MVMAKTSILPTEKVDDSGYAGGRGTSKRGWDYQHLTAFLCSTEPVLIFGQESATAHY